MDCLSPSCMPCFILPVSPPLYAMPCPAYPVLSCPVLSCPSCSILPIQSCFAFSSVQPTFSCPVMPVLICPVLSCMFCYSLSYHDLAVFCHPCMSCHACSDLPCISCPILSCMLCSVIPVLSCSILFCLSSVQPTLAWPVMPVLICPAYTVLYVMFC